MFLLCEHLYVLNYIFYTDFENKNIILNNPQILSDKQFSLEEESAQVICFVSSACQCLHVCLQGTFTLLVSGEITSVLKIHVIWHVMLCWWVISS